MRSRIEPLNGVALLLVGVVVFAQVDFIRCSPSRMAVTMPSASSGVGQPSQIWGIYIPSPKMTNGKISNNLGLGQTNVKTLQGKPVYSPKPPTFVRMANHHKSPSSSLASITKVQANVQTQGKRVYPSKPRTSPRMANHQSSSSPCSSLTSTAKAQAKRGLESPSPSPSPDCKKAQAKQTIGSSFPPRSDSIEAHAQAGQTIAFSFPPRPDDMEAHIRAEQTIGSSFPPRPNDIEAHAEAEQTLGSSPAPSPSDTKPQAEQISGSPIAPPTPSVFPTSGRTMTDTPTPPPSPKMPIHQGDNSQRPDHAGPTGWVVQWGCGPAPDGCWWTYNSGPGMPIIVYPSGSNGPSPNLVAYGGAAGLSYGSNGALYPGVYYYH